MATATRISYSSTTIETPWGTARLSTSNFPGDDLQVAFMHDDEIDADLGWVGGIEGASGEVSITLSDAHREGHKALAGKKYAYLSDARAACDDGICFVGKGTL